MRALNFKLREVDRENLLSTRNSYTDIFDRPENVLGDNWFVPKEEEDETN